MNLAVFSGQYFWFDGESYSTDEAFVKFVTAFYPYFNKIIFCDAIKSARKKQPYVLDAKYAEVCSLPEFSVYSFWKNILVNYPRIYRIIRDNMFQWDVVWLNAPHPVSLIFAMVCNKLHTPFFFFVRQHLSLCVKYRTRGPKRFLAVSVATALEYIFRRLSRKTVTFTVGKEIFDTYNENGNMVYETSVSLISENDILGSIPKQMPNSLIQARLLSVGRLDPEKGMMYLILAVAELVANGHRNVSLDIVGSGSEEKRLRRKVGDLDLDNYVNFRGYVDHGHLLFALYRRSDVFVVPSLTEGWPQTLFEAMACGLPIVATRVGGIPHLIEDGEDGLLVNPAAPHEICSAVERLMRDWRLRQRLIVNGLDTVRNHTMEAETERIMARLKESLRQKNFPISQFAH